MMKSESSKHVKFSNGGIDRISNLPQPLLSRILSLLPTKNAVATSILSTRWKFLWTSITDLDFCSLEHDWRTTLETKKNLQMKRDKFTLFVNRVLLLLNPPSIQSFRLKCYQDCFDHLYLNSWIAIGFGRTIQEFELSLMLKEPVELPLSHIYCNVTVLKLDGNIRFNIPASASVCFPCVQVLHLIRITSIIAGNSSVSFPNLKIMCLSYVKFADDESIQKLFSSSPVLDDLMIERTNHGDKIFCLIIRIPSLTRLSIDFEALDLDQIYKLQIDSPAHLSDDLPYEYLPADNLSSLIQANVKIHFCDEDEDDVEICNSIIKFIGNLSKVKFLSVSGGVLKAFEIASANISPSFHNLTRLEIKVHYCLDFSVMLDNFLESMDNLEHLVMEGWNDRWNSSCSHHLNQYWWWSEPQNVAKCLLSRVTTISFNYMIVDCIYQLELLRYILKNAEVLQMLTIGMNHISSEKKQLEMVKKISLIPRGSRVCQVAFT